MAEYYVKMFYTKVECVKSVWLAEPIETLRRAGQMIESRECVVNLLVS